jgi:hypothetical protein
MEESTITLPYLWGRTVGKAAKTEPSKPPLTIVVAAFKLAGSKGTRHVTLTISATTVHHTTSTPLSL